MTKEEIRFGVNVNSDPLWLINAVGRAGLDHISILAI